MQCSTLQCSAVQCIFCSSRQCKAVTVQCSAVHFIVVQGSAWQCAVQYSSRDVKCRTVQCSSKAMQCTALYQPSVLNSFCHLSSLLQHTFSLSISICGQFPQVHGKDTGTTGTGSSGSKSSLSDFPLGCGAGSSLNKKILSSFPKGQILAHAECFDLHPRLFLPFR